MSGIGFKWPKGASRNTKSFTSLARAISDDPKIQQEFSEFVQSVAMKTDIKHVNLYESGGTMGTSLQHVAMNEAATGLTWIDPPSISPGGGTDLLCCATYLLAGEGPGSVLIGSEDGTTIAAEVYPTSAEWEADTYSSSWLGASGITVPSDGIYLISATLPFRRAFNGSPNPTSVLTRVYKNSTVIGESLDNSTITGNYSGTTYQSGCIHVDFARYLQDGDIVTAKSWMNHGYTTGTPGLDTYGGTIGSTQHSGSASNITARQCNFAVTLITGSDGGS